MPSQLPASGDPIGQSEGARLGAEQPIDLGGVPDVELALLAFAVGIKAGRESVLDQHLPLQPPDRLEYPRREEGILRVCPSVRQERDQLGIVVEHLLEVRHEPQRVDRIARETTTEVIIDAALAMLTRVCRTAWRIA